MIVTSGTAVGNLLPAVMESCYGYVPLIVLSADRPVELAEVGSPQTCRQSSIFREFVRWEFDTGVIRDEMDWAMSSIARRAYFESVKSPKGPGPVHLNIPLVEPLVARQYLESDVGEFRKKEFTIDVGPTTIELNCRGSIFPESLRENLPAKGVVIAGAPLGEDLVSYCRHIREIAHALGWPTIASPTSGLRDVDFAECICHADLILRSESFIQRNQVECVLRVGTQLASKTLSNYLAKLECLQIVHDPYGDYPDPSRKAELFVRGPISELEEFMRPTEPNNRSPEWLEAWLDADRLLEDQISNRVDRGKELSEPFIARYLTRELPDEIAIFSSSSMAIRELEIFGASSRVTRSVYCNRGLNGIDGVIASAAGVARTSRHSGVIALIGDVAFYHDVGSLGHLAQNSSLVLVVIDNQGGEIFEFLEQSKLESELFTRLFRTPPSIDLFKLASGFCDNVFTCETKPDFHRAITNSLSNSTLSVIICKVGSARTVSLHRAIESQCVEAIGH